jgi:hypothetical protein
MTVNSTPVMPVRPLLLRLLALAVSLVQLAGPAIATFADAQLQAAADSPAAASHIEAHQRPECARVHPDDCALCQYLTGVGQPITPPAPAVVAEARTLPVTRVVGAAPARRGALPRTRAPPGSVLLEA